MARGKLVGRKQKKKDLKSHDLSVVVPVFFEERRIERCIKESLFYLKHCKAVGKYELIFVADRSGDKTISIIKRYAKKDKHVKLIDNKVKLKKGGSVRRGLLEAKYPVFMFMDADLSTPLFEIERFLGMIDKYDLLIGSRGMKESKVTKQWHKMIVSMAFSALKWVMFGLTYKDTQCGFKMFKKSGRLIVENQHIMSGICDVEWLLIAKKNNFSVKEVPVTWIDNDMTNYSVFRLARNVFEDMTRIKRNQLLGLYDLKKTRKSRTSKKSKKK